MKSEKIDYLLEKYWDCETSVEEEKELQAFFLGGDVPAQFQQYIPLFSCIRDEQSVKLSDSFNERFKNNLEGKQRERYVTIRVFKPLLRFAVSVLLIIGMGVSFYFISKQDNRSHFVETFEDPNAAMQHATFALEKLSYALRKTEAASMETIHFIDELDIDWAALDSLNKINLSEMDRVKRRD